MRSTLTFKTQTLSTKVPGSLRDVDLLGAAMLASTMLTKDTM